MILLDLSAAFDTIDHSVLLDRMRDNIGIDGVAHDWFTSYLSGRTQSVQIGQVISLISILLLFGVPQGSVLGPLLFLIYILPLGHIIRKYGFELHIYADDTQLYLALKPASYTQSITEVESCLVDIHTWMSANFLKLNSDKTEVTLFGTWQQLKKYGIDSITVAGVNVKLQQTPVRNLGVMFDPHMTMEAQVSSVVKSVSYNIRNIGRIRRYLTMDSAKKLVNAAVTSRLDYCNSLLSGIAGTQLKRLQRVQKAAAKVVLRLPKFASPSLSELHWLPVEYRIKFKTAVTVFKALNGLAPAYLSELLIPYQPPRSSRSNPDRDNLLLLPKTSNKTAARAFRVNGPSVWNDLPVHTRLSRDVISFKKSLKTHYFRSAFRSNTDILM